MENQTYQTVQTYFNYMHYLHYLPFEVVHNIFAHFSLASLLQELRLVCFVWKYMVDHILIHEVNNQCYRRIIKLTDPICVGIRNFTTEFQETVMFAHTIKRLEFWDIVVSYNLIHFLKECNFVQELKFANVTLDSWRRLKCPDGLSLPKVKVITFNMQSSIEPTIHELILVDFLRQVKFGKLETVNIYTSRIDGYMEIYPLSQIELPSGIKSTGILAFLIENGQSMKKLIVAPRMSPFGSPIEELANQLEQLQLEEMECFIRKGGKYIGNESMLIRGQRALKKLDIYVFYKCWPELTRAIESSALTLTQIIINTFFTSFLQEVDRDAMDEFLAHGLDAAIFRDCSILKSLLLSTSSPIFNLTSLPDSIQSLFLIANFIQDDLLTIASNLTNLEEFNLSYFDFTVTTKIVQAFTGIESLDRLRIEVCRADEDAISEFAKSQDKFEINFEVRTPVEDAHGMLTISKKLTPSEPSIQLS